jgi:large subunit ribosomal protein L28e
MADAGVSPNLVWDVIRTHNAFVKKSSGSTFSCEKGNLRNKHSFKYSGLAQRKSVSVHDEVSMKDDTPVRRIVMTVGKSNVNQPVISKKTTKVEGFLGAVDAIKAVNAATYGDYYRPDMRATALARLSALRNSRRTKFAKRTVARATRIRSEQLSYDHLEAEDDDEEEDKAQ